jgi:hypothetical protein
VSDSTQLSTHNNDLDARLEAFEDAWLARLVGTSPPRWQDHLPTPQQHCTPGFVVEFLKIDIECRVKEGHRALLGEAYFDHPRLQRDDARLTAVQQMELIRREYQLRWVRGERPALRPYLARFPQHAELQLLRPLWNCPHCNCPEIPLSDETAREATCPSCRNTWSLGRLFPPLVALASLAEATQINCIPPTKGADSAGDQPVETAGRYQLLEAIGHGGMGVVFRAHDPDLNRTLAVKMMPAGSLERSDFHEWEQRFRAEAQVTGQLQHPGIPPVHEVGSLSDGRPFFAMKLIKGQTLADDARRPAPRTHRSCRDLAPLRCCLRAGVRDAGVCPQQGSDPPRPQASEHHGGRLRRSPGHGLGARQGPGPGLLPPSTPHPCCGEGGARDAACADERHCDGAE